MTKTKSTERFAIGAAIAGAVGYLVGVLTAPKAGKQTRQELKQAANTNLNDVERQLKALQTELGRMVEQAKVGGLEMSDKAQKKFSVSLEKANVAKDKLHEVLSSLHEGEANDKDLQTALDEAKKSLEHLKSYMKK